MRLLRLDSEEWRCHSVEEGGGPIDDLGDPGASTNTSTAGIDAGFGSPPPPPPNPNASYPTGPSRGHGRGHSSAPPPPPDPWAGIAGAVRDQANALVDKWLATIGYPSGIDAHSLALQLAKSGVNLTGSPFDAYEWMFGLLNDGMRQANPWAEFGMGKDDYGSTVSKLNSVMVTWTGDPLDAGTIKSAIRGSWTPDEIRNFAMFGNPEGTGQLLDVAKFEGDMPWLGQGQTFTQTEQGFEQFEGHTPTDKATLAAWFRFGVGTKTLGQGREAGQRAAPQAQITSEVR